MNVTVKAYAKINLFLDIDSLRDDGYHNILSLMQSVSLHDTVSVEYENSDEKTIVINCSTPGVPCDSKNLAYKAANLYPITGKITILIEKRIPMSAGLAGGSADAAAVLIALNSISSAPMSVDDLKALGNKLGADVPFCIETGSCIAMGTGDILKKTASMPACTIVIAKKGDGMSTPEAYRALDEKYNRFLDYKCAQNKLDILLSARDVCDLHDYSEGLFNIFESVVEPCRPCVTELKNIMLSNGAVSSMMSGSGTSVFGLFENEDDASRAVDELTLCGADAHLCYPIKK